MRSCSNPWWFLITLHLSCFMATSEKLECPFLLRLPQNWILTSDRPTGWLSLARACWCWRPSHSLIILPGYKAISPGCEKCCAELGDTGRSSTEQTWMTYSSGCFSLEMKPKEFIFLNLFIYLSVHQSHWKSKLTVMEQLELEGTHSDQLENNAGSSCGLGHK